ncbi:putative phage tail assembly chaperone [Shewanella halifaxensis]|uniref:putative phage tail assembly chaperone n=1 Tax=Shewanella halifaxensis TaxID=271098 RepID=UPI000D59E5DB|nr:putative phage tail assembly chaperone [Shewanella halifaxensis]
MKKQIVLTIGTSEFKFAVTANDHADFVDVVSRGGSMCSGAHNFVMRSISAEQKDELKSLLTESPGAEVQIAGALKAEFSPVLEIAVKK